MPTAHGPNPLLAGTVAALLSILNCPNFGLAAEQPAPESFRAHPWLMGPLTQRLEGDTEISWTSDLLLTESAARFEQDLGGIRREIDFTHNSYNEHYRPFRPADLFGFAEELHENRYTGQATVRAKI